MIFIYTIDEALFSFYNFSFETLFEQNRQSDFLILLFKNPLILKLKNDKKMELIAEYLRFYLALTFKLMINNLIVFVGGRLPKLVFAW